MEHGPNHERPLPEDVGGQEEYEVESIIKHQYLKKARKWQYFVKWKGWPDSDNNWNDLADMGNATELIVAYHKKKKHKPSERPSEIFIAIITIPKWKWRLADVRARCRKLAEAEGIKTPTKTS